ncbi:hypothetical protein [Frankia sp. CcWB3]
MIEGKDMQSRTLPVFTATERDLVQMGLAMKVAEMMGRKLEEADWSDVYCSAKNIPLQGWSNLNIDVMHEGLGVEHKMLRYKSKSIEEACGTTLMHPSLTRSVRIPTIEADANDIMVDVFKQYAELVLNRRRKVENQTAQRPVDMRIGWLLWQDSLRQFLYFEEPMSAPDPNNYIAEWRDVAGSSRKGSKNLWIYERSTGKKRYSVTTSAGIKIQPYFDVPPPSDPNLYIFTVIGEQVDLGIIRVWLTPQTHGLLRRAAKGKLDIDDLSRFVSSSASAVKPLEGSASGPEQVRAGAVPLFLRESAYRQLTEAFQGVNDEHCFQLLLEGLDRIGDLALD